MAGTLREKNLFLVWSNNFFFFTWKFETTDFGKNAQSSRFNLGEGKPDSFLEMEFSSFWDMGLYLHNPVIANNGRFVIVITGAESAVIHSHVASNNCFENSCKVDLLKSLTDKSPFSLCAEYPIIITCTWWKDLDECVLCKTPDEKTSDSILLNNLKELSSDFKKVLGHDMYSDVILKVGEDNIKAHKMILQVRSPVFNKMFSSDLLETTANVVVISDIGATTIKRLVSYLYTGRVEKCNFEETLELYGAADKYEVLSLRDNCKMELLNLLEVDNACSIFALANRHCDEDLKKSVVKFISAHYLTVVDSDSFGELSKDDILVLTRLYASIVKGQNSEQRSTSET